MFTFTRYANGRSDRIAAAIDTLVIAGWTGRDAHAIQHHIEELAALGVPRPSTVPLFYRVAATQLTQASALQVLGPDSSGEVEPVIVALADGLWLGIGSDHTDRKAESISVALSKQLCGKVIGTELWRLDEISADWDKLILRAHAEIGGQRVLYQEGPLAGIRPPDDLIRRYTNADTLPPGTAMFCGTLGAKGGVRPGTKFEMEIEDPVRRRALRHAYTIEALPVIA
ncbi:MAG TPA: DUF2848 domain-containing protein [Alphaproteobacteria bacterium]|nr:DUF2848 domain-containing protein [Alphaproteobacteria bacterium]